MTEKEKQAWRDFINTTPAYYPSTPNNGLLARNLYAAGLPTTVKTLTQAYLELRDALEMKPTQQPPPPALPQMPTDEPIDECKLPDFPVRGSLESGWRYDQRLTAWREQRAQQAWKTRENKRLAAEPPAQSTIDRTKADLRLRKIEQEQYALRKANQS
jgi:hypothetical protein